jgi:DNA-binding NarL/FixJ family response regulator
MFMYNKWNLTEREIDVAKLVAKGKTNKEIGLTLGIETQTVKFHMTHILKKMNVSSRLLVALRLLGTNERLSFGETKDGALLSGERSWM